MDKKIDFSNEDHCGPCGELLKNSSYLRSKKDKEK
jgi:hypothetical protein